MRLRIPCSCGKVLIVDEKFVGKSAKCPGCSTMVAVTAAAARDGGAAGEISGVARFIIGGFVAAGTLAIVLLALGLFLAVRWSMEDPAKPPDPVARVDNNDTNNTTPANTETPGPAKSESAKKEPTPPPVDEDLTGTKRPEPSRAETVKKKENLESPPTPKKTEPDIKTPGVDPKEPVVPSKEPEMPPKEPTVIKTPDPVKPPVERNPEPVRGISVSTENFILPIEIIAPKDTTIPYQIRRLKLPDEQRKRLRMAVTPAQYDNMGRLLDGLGEGYRYTGVDDFDLGSLSKLREFDVLFLTCKGGNKSMPFVTLPLTELKVANDKEREEKLQADIKKWNEQKEINLKKQLAKREAYLKANKIPYDANAEVAKLVKAAKAQEEKELQQQQQMFEQMSPQQKAPAVLRRFVEEGGTLYSSDLRYDQVLSAFPEIRFNAPPNFAFLPSPQKGDYVADVIDSGLRQHLGVDKLDLHFNLGGWKPAIFNEKKVKFLLQGVPKDSPKTAKGQQIRYPLAVKYQCGRGTMIFTSFHNAAQNSDTEKKLLEYLVFSVINAKAEAKLKEIMLAAEFALPELQVLSFSKGKGDVVKTHAHKGGGLNVAVGFEHLGATLRVSLRSPSGKTIAHQEPGLYLIEVPNAEVGDWECTVSAVTLPFDNFPAILGISRGK